MHMESMGQRLTGFRIKKFTSGLATFEEHDQRHIERHKNQHSGLRFRSKDFKKKEENLIEADACQPIEPWKISCSGTK